MTGFSSLPLASEEGDAGQNARKFTGVAHIVGPRWAHLPTLTVGLLGVQVFWSVEMSYASPYLLSLGLSKSSMAIVFLAGPLSGLIMQPLIGVLADNSTSRFGRRRPYMMLGTVLCMAGMLLLGFTRPVASIFTTLGSSANDTLTIWLAVLAIYFIDFAINAVQAMDRALLVDTLPTSKQAPGNAWAAKMLGVGAVVGFFVGKLELTKAFPYLGRTQLEVLSVIVSFFLFTTHSITALFVKERVLLKSTQVEGKTKKQNAFIREVKDIWSNVLTLPWVIRQICFIQFCAWIAWFPVLFYSSIYVGDFHKHASPVPTTAEGRAALDADATRMGSRALFYSSLIALVCNFALPLFILKSNPRNGLPEAQGRYSRFAIPAVLKFHLASLWAFSHLIFALCMFATFFTHSLAGATALIAITGFSWAVTQWAPFALLAEAILTEPGPATADDGGSIQLEDARTRNHDERTAFLVGNDSDGEDDDDVRKAEENRRMLLGNPSAHVSTLDVDRSGSRSTDNEYEIVNGSDAYDSPRTSTRHDREDDGLDTSDANPSGGLSAKAGIILGIHNVFIVIPQFLVTGLSSIIFALFDEKPAVPPHSGAAPAPVLNGTDVLNAVKNVSSALADTVRGRDNLYHLLPRAEDAVPTAKANSVVYVFRLGGVAATFAFVLCWRLAREMRHR
ncbi:sucrose transporter [Coprinopsis cinerea AmutBmut pab1-1]|nr:sucrose transporter [Coprinopsis cinerea AmutBmut pab1-1]